MWAVVEINKKQYIVKPGDTLEVERLVQKEGDIILDKVLLLSDGQKVSVGTPYLSGVKVKAVVKGEEKGDKVISYKYTRREKSRWKKGHRQIYSLLQISDIVG